MIKVYIEPAVLEKIRHWVGLATGEVSCLGIVEKEADDLVVTDIFLPRQACTTGSTEMEPASVAELQIELERSGIDSSKLRLWLHSHGDMKTFWSNTDADTVELLANDGFVVSIVVNKAGDMLTRVDLFQPFRHTFDKVPTEALLPDLGLFEECQREFIDKVDEQSHHTNVRRIGGDHLSDADEEFWTDESMFFWDNYEELEQKLNNGEITVSEYWRQLDKLGVCS